MRIAQKPTPSTDLSEIIFGRNGPTPFMRKVRKVRAPVDGVVRKKRKPKFGDIGVIVDVPEPVSDEYYDTLLTDPSQFIVETEFEEETPVELPYNGVVADNEFIVEPEEVVAVNADVVVKDMAIRVAMRENMALLLGVDTASNYIEALSKDVIGTEVEVDGTLEEALVPLLRLNTFVAATQTLSHIPEQTKAYLIRTLTRLTASEVVAAFKEGKRKEGLEAMRKYYAASVSKAGIEPDDVEDVNTLGVRTSRR